VGKDTENNAVAMALMVKMLQENIVAVIECNRLNARVQREKYNALIKEGFTAEQALMLVK
jgi:hypothetical protein